MNQLLAMGAILALAIIDWTVTARRWMRLRYLTKPAVLLALLAWFLLTGLSNGFLARSLAASWFATGLFFSLIGDIFLMIPRNYFMAGLGSFLAAHLAYIISFNASGNPSLGIPQVILVLVVAAWALAYYTRIRTGLEHHPRTTHRLPLAIALYSLVITWMLLSALLTFFRPEWQPAAALLVSAGGLLFFSSDSILAYDRFVRELPNGRLLVIITYHLGQAALTAGMITHLVRA